MPRWFLEKHIVTDFATQLRALWPTQMAQVNTLIAHCTQHTLPLIAGPAAHLLQAGGKRLRPLITLSFASLANNNVPNQGACELAAAVELLHAATLMHDDVIDHATQRRGQPSVNIAFGNKCAILCGDYLFACAFGGMTRAESPRALSVLSEASKTIIEGELLQLSLQGKIPTIQEYLTLIDCKTAALFAAAAEAGVAVADGTPQQQQAAQEFGNAYGIIFQLIDDWLDYTGDHTLLGKQTGSDIAEGKLTLPALYAHTQGTPSEQEFWQQAAAHGSSDLAYAQELLHKYHTQDYMQQQLAQYTHRAQTALQHFATNHVQELLHHMLQDGLTRLC